MKSSLFVGGLDFSMTTEELTSLFSQYGTVVTAKIITDMYTGKSRGFAFVDMSSAEEAAECVKNLHNSTQKNRQITVREKEERPRKSSGGGFGGGSNYRRSY